MNKIIIYSYENKGTALPRYASCKVYNDGSLIVEEGSLLDKKDKYVAKRKLSRDVVRDIERIIDRNYEIFDISDKDLMHPFLLVEDGTRNIISFSDELQRATFHINDLPFYKDFLQSNDGLLNSNMELVLKVYQEIRETLIRNGLSEEHF